MSSNTLPASAKIVRRISSFRTQLKDVVNRKWLLLAVGILLTTTLLFVSRHASASNITWDGGGVTNNWSEAANWSGDTIPGAGDVAVFDGTSTKNSTIDAAFGGTVGGIQITSGYTGTITHASGATLTAGSIDQSGGTFSGGANDIFLNGSFTFSGGTFNAPSGTLTISTGLNMSAAAIFNPDSGTVAFVGGSGSETFLPTTLTFNNIIVNKTSNAFIRFNTISTLVATGTLTLTDGRIIVNNGGTLEGRGPVSIASTFDGGDATLLISGASARAITLPAGVTLPAFTVNAPNVTISGSGSGTVTFNRTVDIISASSFTNGPVNLLFTQPVFFEGVNFTLGSGDLTCDSTFQQSGGVFNPGSGALNFLSTFTLSGGTFIAPSGTLTFSRDVTISAAATFNPNNGTVLFTGNVGSSLVIPPSLTLNNLTVNKNDGLAVGFSSDSTLIVNGTLTLTDGKVNVNNGSTIDARGAVSIASTFDGGDVILLVSGPAARTVTLPGGATLPAFTVNAPNVTLNTSGAGTVTFNRTVDIISASSFTNGPVSLLFTQPVFFEGVNFTLGSGDFTCNSTFAQTGGIFNPGSGGLNFLSTFTVNGGTFIAPAGPLTFFRDVNVGAAATFNPNNGTIVFMGSVGSTLVIPASLTLNNLTVNKNDGVSVSFSTDSTLIVNGTLTLADGRVNVNNSSTIDGRGAVNIASTFDGGNVILLVSGPASRTVTLPAGATLPAFTVNAPNVTINGSGSGTVTFSQTVDIISASSFTNGAVNLLFSNQVFFEGVNFTLGSGDLTFNNNFTQSGGTFNQGSGSLNFANFAVTGGTFNAPAGTLNFSNNVTIGAAATFNTNGGTIAFVGNIGANMFLPASLTLNNVTFNKANGVTVGFGSDSTMVVAGVLSLTDGRINVNNGSTLEARGPVTIASTFDFCATSLSFTGSANQTFTNNGGENPIGAWTINKPSGTVTLASNLNLANNQPLNITSGTLDQASFNLQTSNTLSIGTNGTLRDFGTGDLTLGGSLVNNGVFNFNGGGTNCGDPNLGNQILIRSTSTGTTRAWSGSGAFSVVDVDVQDQDASAIAGGITAFGSSSIANSPGWILNAGCPITVSSSPTNVSACPGSAANFVVAFLGGSTIQWRKDGNNLSNGGNITGANANTLTINPVGAADAASSPGYDAVGTNSFGVTAVSNAATLTLLSAPIITGSPSSATRCDGDSVTFLASATGDNLTFQWRKDGNNINGANGTSFTIDPIALGDAGVYDVVVSGSCNPPAVSAPATLTVNAKPAINAQPTDQQACDGGSASFTVGASGTGLTFQWRRNGVPLSNGGNISGATTATLTINPVGPGDSATSGNGYDVVISGTCNPAVTSTRHALTVSGFSLSANSQTFPASGGNGSVAVITGGTCAWTAVSNDSFIHITSGGGGTGNGTVTFTVDSTSAARSGTMTIAGLTFTVNQSAPTVGCTPPPAGMVAWWPGEGNGNDIRGENNGTLENVSFVPGKVGQAFGFSGLRGVLVPDAEILNQQKFTIDAWFTAVPFTCPGGVGTCAAFIAAKSGSDGNSGYEVDVRENGTLNFFLNGGLGGGVVSSIGTFADGAFHHVAATYDGAAMKLYIDGTLNNQTSVSTTVNYPAGHPFFIGGRELSGPTVPYPGKVDEPEFFTRALDLSEVQAIFNADTAGKCRPTCTAAPNNLVSWWTGDDNPFDLHGNNHGAMPPSGAGFGTGKVGRAFTFDGSQNPVAIPDSPTLDTPALTIDAWVFPTSLDGAEDIIINKEVIGTVQYEMSIKGPISSGGSIPQGNLAVFVGGVSGLPNDDGGWVDARGRVPLNTWTHVAMSFDGSTLSAYINGVLTRVVTGLSGAPPSTSGPFRIGARNPSVAFATDPFNGSIDEVDFFDRGLSASEIQVINNAGFTGKCKLCVSPPDSMVGWWNADANTNDSSGNGNDGTAVGATTFGIGKVGQSFRFATGYIRIRDSVSLRPTNLTLDGWINFNTASPGTAAIFGKAVGTGTRDSYQIFYENGQLQAMVGDVSGEGPRLQFPLTPVPGTWYHVAFTFDDVTDSQALYLNGVLVASGGVTKTIGYDNNPFLISSDTENGVEGTFPFPGSIDEVEIFSRALSQTEIQKIVAAGTSGKCKRANTPTGANVNNQLGDSTLTFSNVTGAGTTTYQTLPTYQPGPMPFGYNPPLHAADISTNASFTGGVRVCFNLQATEFAGPFNQLRILHLEGNDLVNRTSDSQASTHTLCANVTSLSPFVIAQNVNAPTAANGVISGRILTPGGTPVVGAVINLAGAQARKTITDANGRYQFNHVETNGFYTVTPARANFVFSPALRSFNQLGEHTEAAFTGSDLGDLSNPLDMPEYFVRQQYVDILGREPEEGGFNYWSDRILECGNDLACANARRRDVAAAFFIEREFQQTGSFIYGLYKAGLGRRPLYNEFAADRQHVVEGGDLEALKQTFAEAFVARPEFVSRYQSSSSAESFVDELIRNVQINSGIDLSSQRQSLINRYNTGSSLNQSRSLALRELSEGVAFRQAEYNGAFVLTEYFAYLRRDPDLGGYNFWLDVLNNRDTGNFRGMVCAFITSTEYQQRFSAVISHSNQDCAQ